MWTHPTLAWAHVQVTAEEVTSSNPTSVDLRPEMVVVHDSKINYANKVRLL